MSKPEKLVQATLNRLGARIGKKLLMSATEFLELAKDAPEKFRSEWDLFQEEVMEEANRLEKEESEEESFQEEVSEKSTVESPQTKITRIRTKITQVNTRLEGRY